MSTTEPEAPAPRRSLFRIGFPCLLIVLAIGVPSVLWSLPDEKLSADARSHRRGLILVASASAAAGHLLSPGRAARCVARRYSQPAVHTHHRRQKRWRPDAHLRASEILSTPRERPGQPRAAPRDSAEAKPTCWCHGRGHAAYRGVNRDGVAMGPALERDWTTHPPRQLWRHPVGAGYAASPSPRRRHHHRTA